MLPLSWSMEREEWDLLHTIITDISGNSGKIDDDLDMRVFNFNRGCGNCHSSGFDGGYDMASGKYNSRFAEGAISCETCHGPGKRHVQWHSAARGTGLDYESPAQLLHPGDQLDSEGRFLTCARCHFVGEWRFAIDFRPHHWNSCARGERSKSVR